jgi:helix-turn-helix protein
MSDAMVAYVRTRSKSTGMAKFLLVLLASHHNHLTGLCNPSLDTLAWEFTRSKAYVIKLLHQLEQLGELQILRGHGRTHVNHYIFTLPDEERPRPEKVTSGVTISPRQKVTLESRKGHPGSHKRSPQSDPKVLKEKKDASALAPEMPRHRCIWDGCMTPACPHEVQLCAYHACCRPCLETP